MPVFYATNGAKNFVGMHANGAAAIAFVLAQFWDTLGTGLGTVQEGMMYYDTTSHQMYYWDGAAWINYSGEIEGGVYVDATYGSDVSGDGTIGRPYATLSNACTVQPAPDPLDVMTFVNPLTFFLAPGAYIDPVTFPQRMEVSIVGRNCLLGNVISWDIDPEMWDTYGLNVATDLPHLRIAAEISVLGDMDASEFWLETGELVVANSNTGTGFPMPVHVLEISGVRRNDFKIYNSSASVIGPGLSVASDATNSMQLYLRDSPATGTCTIAGEVDRDTVGGVIVENAVVINAVRSSVDMRAVCRIEMLEDCDYSADWQVDHDGLPYDYGLICGDGNIDGNVGGHLRNSTVTVDSFFGFNGSAILPVPKHTHADAIVFDRDSLLRMARICADLSASFAGFAIGLSSDAYGRGWWFGYEEQVSDYSRLTIPCGEAPPAWSLFKHTYDNSHHFVPNGDALSAANRLTIELESGMYTMPKADFEFGFDFINVVGKGSEVLRFLSPNVVINCGTRETTWTADYASLENLTLMESNGVPGTEEYCLLMKGRATGCTFKNLSFVAHPSSLGTVLAVVLDPVLVGSSLLGTWEDCHTVLAGFLYGGNVGSVCNRCTTGAYSFGGWHGAAAADVDCTGMFVDCWAGNYSFGATDVGGNANFNHATALRCKVSGYGFGHTSGGGGPAYTADCSGTLTDCENYVTGGSMSFGASTTGEAECSAVLVRCSSGPRSFGCSLEPTSIGRFSGDATDCDASYCSFGSNGTDPLYGEFTGTARRCRASYRSFGGTGLFSGSATECEATYGSFGIAKAKTKGRMDRCRVTDIRAAAGQGPPTIWGGTLMNCYLATKAGENIQPLLLSGGTVAAGDESRVYNCDLYTNTAASSIETTTGNVYDAQIAHCRMNVDISANVNNVLGAPYNMVDAAYNPT